MPIDKFGRHFMTRDLKYYSVLTINGKNSGQEYHIGNTALGYFYNIQEHTGPKNIYSVPLNSVIEDIVVYPHNVSIYLERGGKVIKDFVGVQLLKNDWLMFLSPFSTSADLYIRIVLKCPVFHDE